MMDITHTHTKIDSVSKTKNHSFFEQDIHAFIYHLAIIVNKVGNSR